MSICNIRIKRNNRYVLFVIFLLVSASLLVYALLVRP